MKVIILKSAAGLSGSYKKGEIRDLDTSDALPLIAAGLAQAVADKPQERAEKAVQPKQEKRKR